VVGGSLAGLAAARMLARNGAAVVVLERGRSGFEGRRGGLGLDCASAARQCAGALPAHLVLTERSVTSDGRESVAPAALQVTP
jgi:flavin-dependent dehydrogenase